MDLQTAVMAFSQSDKIKSGLIWASQLAGMHASLSEMEKRGAGLTIQHLLAMLADELRLARRNAGGAEWAEAAKHMEMALVMAHSGVIEESAFHMARALRQVTGVGQRAMTVLKDHGMVRIGESRP